MSRLLTIVVATAAAWLPTAVGVAAEPVDFFRDIKPILRERCFACHGALKQKSGLRLDTGQQIRKGGESGPAVVPLRAAESLLVERITAADAASRMPPEGMPLTAEEIARIRTWIDQGALSPETEQPEEDPRQHWAFQKPVRPMPPITGGGLPSGNPIDAFLAAGHARAGITPRPSADKQVLLRRVYLDLVGLPPTREELHGLLADDSPAAYEDVVDRLLQDPRYGERWGRHWMDIWRYSDWYGRRHVPDVWNSAPQIWRWRDWIVRSLNADHGYDRMVREMLAADEICPEDDEATVATGYLIRNWYALNPNDWLRSTVEHTGKALLGLTFNCAHCHDHKYDPITQDDYFRLRAFFEPIGVRQDRVPGEADPGPFQEYNYSTLRKIQRLGAVRIYDKNAAAPTWFYAGGDERNRLTDRGSIAPGVPAFLAEPAPRIEPVELPPRFWYPGLRPAVQQTVLADCRRAVAAAQVELEAARKAAEQTPPVPGREQLAHAEAALAAAISEAEQAGRPGALAGRQSLLLDAGQGRRAIHNGLAQLKTLEDGSTISFELLILSDAHFNFQLAKDSANGLTAGYVGFDQGRILSYQPGSVTEFEAGRYDIAAGQKRFLVSLVLETNADRCLLSVRSQTDQKLLVDQAPVALGGWNPIGDPAKAISFDARTGSVALIDSVTLAAPAAAGAVAFDFEPPTYLAGRDVAGIEGWAISTFSALPASSVVSTTAANESLWKAERDVQTARRAVEAATLPLRASEACHAAAVIELASAEARIAADQARFSEWRAAEAESLAGAASRLERAANLRKAEAESLAKEFLLATAEAKPTTDAKRAAEIDAAGKQVAAAQDALEKARAAAADPAVTTTYTPLSPEFPKTSTGRRRALAEWITSRQNPLTARVAANHIWARHFHAPLVGTVTDFGRNGQRPAHPELLDWLAVELMDSQWSMKRLHRLIVTSEAYRRASSVGSAAHEAAADPENKLLWRMNVGRMEAEVVRDSLLYAAADLDLAMGGQELENSQSLTTSRRSLYYSVYPEEGGKSQLGELFDAPDALDCYRRTRSVVPQQALALSNSDLVHRLSIKLEEMIRREGQAGEQFLVAAFERILSRAPTPAEIEACSLYLAEHAKLSVRPDESGRDLYARQSLVRVLFNHNDFVTIR